MIDRVLHEKALAVFVNGSGETNRDNASNAGVRRKRGGPCVTGQIATRFLRWSRGDRR